MLGVLPEFKSGAIAMHYRQVPDMAGPLLRALEKMVGTPRANS
jgi:hypothetical protein